MVYFYLGAFDEDECFVNGLELPPLLDREYNDESLTLTLPGDETMDGWGAISVWCAAFDVNFTSASFLRPCLADVNGDDVVDFADLLVLLEAWGECPAKGACPADVDQSGEVDFNDILALLSDWGACPTAEQGGC